MISLAELPVEQGIRIPMTVWRNRENNYADLMGQLKETGDSVLVPGVKIKNVFKTLATRAAFHGYRISCRTEDTGVRVWRLAPDAPRRRVKAA